MYLNSLRLHHFRNYEDLELAFSPKVNLLVGPNGMGKTNLLEAIYYLSCARSHRTSRDQDLAFRGQGSFFLEASFEKENQSIPDLTPYDTKTLSIAYGNNKRTISYNRLELDAFADLFGLVQTVIFAPEDLQLVKGGPGERRRFLDILISKTDREYFMQLQQMRKLLAAKNQILKDLQGKTLDFYLDGLDRSLAKVSAGIALARKKTLASLEVKAKEALLALSRGTEKLEVSYRTLRGVNEAQGLEDLEEVFWQRFVQDRPRDLERAFAQTGVHRDNVAFTINDLDARIFASQGQQRSLVLALKVAELSYIEEQTGQRSILLLDDVLSELDPSRRFMIFDLIRDGQTVITGTDLDPDLASHLQDLEASMFEVQDGKIFPWKPPTP